MPFESLQTEVKGAAPGPVRAGIQKEDIVPELFYLMEYGACKCTLAGDPPQTVVSVRLTSAGIDLYEQLILRKYDF